MLPSFQPVHVELDSDSPSARFLRAAQSGTLNDVREALSTPGTAPLAYWTHEGKNEDALLIAIRSNHNPEVADYLVEIGLDRCDRSHLTQPVSMALAWQKNFTLLEKVINRGYPLEIEGPDQQTVLMISAAVGDARSVSFLIEEGADHGALDEYNQSALHHASSADVVNLLIDAGADIEETDNASRTPLSQAAELGRDEVVVALAKRGANLEAVDEDGDTPLHSSITGERFNVTFCLLDCGANIEARDERGATPFILAASYGDRFLITELHKRGAMVEARDKSERTALFSAITDADLDAVTLLLDLGADLHAEDDEGYTPLMAAAIRNDAAMVSELVARGARLEARNQFQETALLCAARQDSDEAFMQLLSLGADTSARNNIGHDIHGVMGTPEILAAYAAWTAREAIRAKAVDGLRMKATTSSKK